LPDLSPLGEIQGGFFIAMNNVRIIGIDPGARKVGIGIIDSTFTSGSIKPVFIKTIRLNLETTLSERLTELFNSLMIILNEYKPHKAAVEDIFVNKKNLRSSLILGQARGVILLALGLMKITIIDLSPQNIKKGVTGDSLASKIKVAEMVKNILKLKNRPPEDAADALAMAILSVR
jgi:crossover junction endodeoxyribonuclease RuvC